ncbi:hypothetical protein D3C81_1642630 [compost metagenome]
MRGCFLAQAVQNAQVRISSCERSVAVDDQFLKVERYAISHQGHDRIIQAISLDVVFQRVIGDVDLSDYFLRVQRDHGSRRLAALSFSQGNAFNARTQNAITEAELFNLHRVNRHLNGTSIAQDCRRVDQFPVKAVKLGWVHQTARGEVGQRHCCFFNNLTVARHCVSSSSLIGMLLIIDETSYRKRICFFRHFLARLLRDRQRRGPS